MDKVQYWLRLYDERMSDAQALYTTDRYSMCVALCCQSIECVIKAYHVKYAGDPLPIHELPRLCENAGLWGVLTDGQRDLISGISPYYNMTRYPRDINRMLALLDKENTKALLDKTVEICIYIRSII